MVRGITSISEVCVVLLEGCGIVGVAGVSGRTFTALNRERINVIVISQVCAFAHCAAPYPPPPSGPPPPLRKRGRPHRRTHCLSLRCC